MTAGEMLALLDEMIAKAEGKRLRRRDPCVLLRGKPRVLGETGTWVSEDEHGAVYVFTLGQARAMREVILAAAREDAKAAGLL